MESWLHDSRFPHLKMTKDMASVKKTQKKRHSLKQFSAMVLVQIPSWGLLYGVNRYIWGIICNVIYKRKTQWKRSPVLPGFKSIQLPIQMLLHRQTPEMLYIVVRTVWMGTKIQVNFKQMKCFRDSSCLIINAQMPLFLSPVSPTVMQSLNWLGLDPWAQVGNVCLNHLHKVRDG